MMRLALTLLVLDRDDWGLVLSAAGLLVTVASLVTALFIYLIQRKISAKQSNQTAQVADLTRELTGLTKELREKVFGTLATFEQVDDRVVQLLQRANEDEGCDLAVMLYWLWFGADTRLRDGRTRLSELTPFDSRVRTELSRRAISGYETTLVLMDPARSKDKLCRFLDAVAKWQLRNADKARSLENEEIEETIAKYMADLKDFEKELPKQATQRFKAMCRHQQVPMLMLAARSRGGNWHQAIVFLGEVEALEVGAKMGGFVSEDPEIVEVVYAQITSVYSTCMTNLPQAVNR